MPELVEKESINPKLQQEQIMTYDDSNDYEGR